MTKPDFANCVMVKDVAVLDEHDLYLKEDGEEKRIQVDADRLRRICKNMNDRINETGDYVPLIVGHTEDGKSEDKQPEIVGWAGPFEVKRLGRSKRMALFAKCWHIFKDKVAKVRNFPRRSVELWLGRNEIDPIALLGATAPERNLGLVRLNRADTKVRRVLPLKYQLNPSLESKTHMMPSDSPASAPTPAEQNPVVQQVIEALKQTDVWKWVEGQMAQGQKDDMMADDSSLFPEDDTGMPQAPEATEAQAPAPEAPVPAPEGEVPAQEEEEPVKEQASSASGTNTFVPGMKDKKNRMVGYSRSGLESEVIRLRRDYDRLEKENNTHKLAFRRMSREKDLVQLEAEGFLLDREEEMVDALTMDDQVWSRRVNTIRARYQRAPISNHLWLAEQSRLPGAPKSLTRDQMNEAVDYARDHNVTFAEAKEKLFS